MCIRDRIYGDAPGDYSDPLGLGTLHELYNNMEEINWEIRENTLSEFIITDFNEVGGRVIGFWSGDVKRIGINGSIRLPAYGSFVIKVIE